MTESVLIHFKISMKLLEHLALGYANMIQKFLTKDDASQKHHIYSITFYFTLLIVI